MTTGPDNSDGREERLQDIVADYLEQVAAGRSGPPEGLLARHPEFADELAEFFAVRGQLDAAVGPLRVALLGEERVPPTADRPAAEGAGRLGDFRLLREVGRGGMGIVYEAEQISLGRRVALKVLPFAATLDPRQLQRFKNEALAAAALDHPHVVAVIGVGCERGTHYYAMRFVDGHSLAEIIDQLRRVGRAVGRPLPDSVSRAFPAGAESPAHDPPTTTAAETRAGGAEAPTRRSSFPTAYFRSVAELGLRVAEALEHAHRQGVVHRDVKPSNLLLDGQGKVWVADFGLARFEAAASLTGTGDVVGTLRYMAPEQALGRPADHRCDVYGLGATLYELLTLRPAFPGTDREELLRRITSEEPPHPRRVDGSIPADLETVALKAMAKDPDERYPTAQALADDLRRFLDDQPILARPPGLAVRARRWARRHRPAVTAAAASALALLVMAVVGLAVNNVLVNRERAEVARQRNEAVANFRMARAAVDRMTRAAQEQLLDAPHMEQVRRELLEDALKFYQQFLAERGDDPVVRQEAALAYGRLGNIHSYLGRHAEAEEALRQAIAMLEELSAGLALGPDPRASLGEFYRCLGWLLETLGRRDEAAAAFGQSVTRLEDLTAAFPGEPEYREQLASSYISLAIATLRHRPGEAEAILRRVIALTEADAHSAHELALGHAALGSLLANTGRPQEAEQAYRRALGIRDSLPADLARRPGYHGQTGSVHLGLGGLFAATGRPEEAERSYRRALDCFEKLAADFPAVPYYRGNLAATHSTLGHLLKTGGRTREAETAYRAALALYQKLRDEFPALPDYERRLLHNHLQLGQVLVRAGRLDDSRAAFGQAVALQDKVGTASPGELGYLPELARSHIDLGHLLVADNRPAEADAAFRQAVAVQEKAEAEFGGKPEARPDLARSHATMARLLRSSGRAPDVEKLCRLALGHYTKLAADATTAAEYRPALAGAWLALGVALQDTGDRPREAEQAYREALSHFAKLAAVAPEYRPGLANVHNNLGTLLRILRRPKEAVEAYGESVALWQKLVTESPTERGYRHQEANARNNLGYLLTETGRAREAEPHHRKALELFETLAVENREHAGYRDGQGMSHSGLSAVHSAAGRLKEAEDARRRAMTLYAELVKSKPRPWYRFKLAEEQSNLGILLAAAGQHAEALQAVREALAAQKKLTVEFPTVVPYRQAATRGQANLARLLVATGRPGEAAKAYGELLKSDPKSAAAHNNLAWLLATCPGDADRDPDRAVELAERAVELAPKDGAFWNTLGVARYRAGNWERAIKALQKSMELRKGGDAFDWFFMAMAHHRLGHADEARLWCDRAVTWAEKNKERLEKDRTQGDELRRFRVEAEALLGQAQPKTPGATKDQSK